MKNNELITLVEETMNEIFAERRKIDTIGVKVMPASHNGAFVHAYEVVTSQDGRPAEHWQIGFNHTVYAIAGKESIVKKLRMMYA